MARIIVIRRYDFQRNQDEAEVVCVSAGDTCFDGDDLDDGETVAKIVAAHLKHEGTVIASSSYYTPHMWYSTEPYISPATGAEYSHSCFLVGLTPAEEEAVFDAIAIAPT